MKKLLALWMFILVCFLMSGTAFPQAEYLINGANPSALTLETVPPNDCATVTIALAPGGIINTPLITAGFWLVYDPSQVSVNDVAVYDGTILPALWDPGFTILVPDPGSGTYFLSVTMRLGFLLMTFGWLMLSFAVKDRGRVKLSFRPSRNLIRSWEMTNCMGFPNCQWYY